MVADKVLSKTEQKSEQLIEFERLLDQYDYKFSKGDLVKGIIIGFDSHGALVDIGAKTAAMVPLKELSNHYTKNPESVVKIGDEHEFLIIKDEDEEGQLTLSLKRVIAAYSWKKLEELKDEDSVIEGEVTAAVKGGILVDVLGLRGFVPSSHVRAKDIETMVGEKIQLKILSLDQQNNNLIMSHRKVVTDQQAEQRKDVFGKLEIGQVVEGEVVRLAEFGAFIDIGGIDGLLPLSQMSWKWVDHPNDLLKVGDKISVEVIGIDHDKQRVSLSLKSQQPDPWEEAQKNIKEGEKVKGKVIRIKHFGAFIEVYPGVEALLPYKEMIEYQNKVNKILSVDDEIETYIVRFNPDDRRISLGADEPQLEQAAPKPVVKQETETEEETALED